MSQSNNLKAGAASTTIEANDSMVIGGGIFPAFVAGQEGQLRASAIIIEKDIKICIVSCDIFKELRGVK